MNQAQTRRALWSVVTGAALSAIVMTATAEPLDSPKTRIDALEKRVATLERKKDAEVAPAVASAPRRKATNAVWTSAADVQRYLQYPGQ
jgi:hypothetical protein